MHALIIEDEPLIGMMIEDELRDIGFTSFDIATRESDAVAFAERQCPALITADDKLVQGSGIDAVRTICADQAIPVVFIMGSTHDFPIPDAIILPKPFASGHLREAIERARNSARVYS